MLRIRFAAPPEQELLRRRLALCDHVVGRRLPSLGDSGRAGHDPHHLRGQTAEILARLLVRDLVQLPELPLAGKSSRFGLEVGRRVAGQLRRLERLRVRHLRVQVVVDEQAPHVLVGVVADELLDVDAAVAELPAFTVGLGDLRLDGDDAFEPRLELVHRAEI
jgi:hypothetical protein